MVVATYEDLIREQERRRRESLVWKTKDGQIFPIKELSDSHLTNIIKMLEGKIHYCEYIPSDLIGDYEDAMG